MDPNSTVKSETFLKVPEEPSFDKDSKGDHFPYHMTDKVTLVDPNLKATYYIRK